MTAEQQFYLQVIAAIFGGLTPLVLGALGLWLRARMKQQDTDRAIKTDDIKTHIDNATHTVQSPAVLVEKINETSVMVPTEPKP